MPIFRNRWYSRKKPTLQIKILKSIVLNGQLSKRKASDILHAQYPDVSDAIEALLERKLIKKSYIDFKSRRAEKYYTLTVNGLKALLEEDLTPKEFWSTMIMLCSISKIQISKNEFERYYQLFEYKYLGHSKIEGYFFQSHFFDKILNKWLVDNSILNSSIVPLSQIVIECIAIKRSLTLQQLVQKTSASEEDVKKVLDNYAMKLDYSSIYYERNKEYSDVDYLNREYLDFMSHSIIVSKSTDQGNNTYELSLFGVMLTIALIRYHHIGIDNTRSPNLDGYVQRPNLFYKEYTVQEYYDRIASNYQDKLPLIFGKWEWLKKQLGLILAYDNFDFLIYKEALSNSMTTTVWFGGNKEFYDNIQALASNAYYMMIIIYMEGKETLQDYHIDQNLQENETELRILPVYQKVKELEILLKYAGTESFLHELELKSSFKEKIAKPDILYTDEIDIIEKVFSEELTFLFYLNLNNITFSANRGYLPKQLAQLSANIISQSQLDLRNDIFSLGTPKDRLLAILKKDKAIKDWFSKWIKDSMDYHEQTKERMSKFYDEISIEK
jgi:hypothetical protein